MNDDELKKLWQQQSLREPNLSATQLIPAMQKQTTQLRRTLMARDARELLACLIACVIFAIFYFTLSQTPISRLGDLIIIGSAIFVAGKLVHARRRNTPAPPGATVVESLRAELNAVRAQSQLLGSVLWWYLLPLTIGILVCSWGSFNGDFGGLVGNIIYTIFVILLNAFIYWLNRRARKNQLLPLEAQLKSLLHSAETGEPMDEPLATGLRKIAVSMAAAEHVKPVEFKVAFGQLAVFGVTGIVGIWFFLMIGLTNWNIPPQIPHKFVQSVQETNHYSFVARKVVDLLNAGNYAGVYALYNKEMSNAFPAKETSDFYSGLVADAGKIESFDVPSGGYHRWMLFELHCRRGNWTMNLALDANDKISGISFQPALKPSENIKAYVLRLFGPLHLALLVPFFLAGLLYSWLIQKTTERAVGISTLGIHLGRGQTLILWDEIKEVRPYRFLHIRNLSLFKESGEKARMHWTPLERHPDLKRAIENFAPANHPIRKFLSLLK